MIEKIIENLESSNIAATLFERLNEILEKHNITLTDEQHQALRNMILLKAMMGDKEVINAFAEATYKSFNDKGAGK
jgi:2,3-bisphosphoglycerate-independent phosphoglycerate mutase